MLKFISLSRYPGTTGQTYYTKFFKKYQLPYVYEPQGTDNLKDSLDRAIEQGVGGISISMPYKQEIIQYLDDVTLPVADHRSCNTIIVDRGLLRGYNSDLHGCKHMLQCILPTDRVSILGDGSMAYMFSKLLESYHSVIYSRKSGNWHSRHQDTDVIINCTALGTSSEISPFNQLPRARVVIDLALKDNQLARQCLNSQTKYIPGIEFYKYQFIQQFKIYTGIQINAEEFDQI
jgi:shikimate dehydrogenase